MPANQSLQEAIDRLQSPDFVAVRRPDGKISTIPTANIEEARRKGYKGASDPEVEKWLAEKKYGDTAGQVGAVAAGAARGATFGLSDPLLTGTGAVKKQALAGVKEVNPTLSTVGEVGGAAASMFIPGGQGAAAAKAGKVGGAALKLTRAATAAPRAVARIGSGIERSIAARIAPEGSSLARQVLAKAGGAAAGGAVEGAAYGAGELISEAALGDTEITADRIISHIGMGALLGAGTGAPLGALGVGARAGASALSRKFKEGGGAKLFFEDLADKSAARAIGARKAHWKKPEKVKAAGREVIDYFEEKGVNFAALKPSEMVDVVQGGVRDVGEELAATTRKIDDIAARTGQGISDRGEDLMRRVKKAVDYDANMSSMIGSEVDAMKAVEKQALNAIEDLATRPKGFTFDDLTELRRDIDKAAYKKRADGTIADATSLRQEHQRSVRHEINNFIREHADRIASAYDPALVGKLGKVNEKWSNLRRGLDIIEDRTAAEASNAPFSLTTQIAGSGAGVMVGGVGGLATAAAVGVGTQLAKSRGWSAVASMANRASKMGALSTAVDGAASRVTRSIDAFIAGEGSKAARAAQVGIINAFDGLEPPPPAEKPKRQEKPTRQGRLVGIGESVSRIASDPARSIERISKHLEDVADVAPNLASALAAKQVRAAQVISSAMPLQPAPVGPLAIKQKAVHSDQELDRFSAVLEAANDPLSILDRLNNRNLSPEAVRVVKELYPEAYKQITQEIAEKVAAAAEDLKYEDKVQLSVLFGVPVDPTMTPDFIAAMQGAFASPDAAVEPGSEGQAQAKPVRIGALDKMKKSDTSQTRTQELRNS